MGILHRHVWLKWSALIEGHGSLKLQFRTCSDCGLIQKRSIGVCDYSSATAANEVIDQTKGDEHD